MSARQGEGIVRKTAGVLRRSDVAAARAAELAGSHFAREFMETLERYTSVDDVCSVIVDGFSGMFGAPISCVYLLDREDQMLRLRAFQGCAEDDLAASWPVTDTILGEPHREAAVASGVWRANEPACAWASEVLGVRRHAAAALAAHEHLAGVAAIAFTGATGLSDTQAEHLAVLAEYSAESLNKALLLAKEERLSVADRLTCLCTRGHFDRRLDEEFGRATKYAHPLSLMMLDLDDLKAFNDAHGRSAGDELLQRASAVIRNVLCDTDVAARYGGGRFAVLLPETGRDGAHKVAERIRHAFGEEYATVEPQSAFSCTISIGIAACPGEARTAPRLVELAELSLRRAKRNGKNLIETDRVRSADLPARPRR